MDDRTGSSFDSFLEEEGILDEVEAVAIKRVDRLSTPARFQRAVADCAAAREDDAAFAEAISALGLVAWNLSHEIERRLKE